MTELSTNSGLNMRTYGCVCAYTQMAKCTYVCYVHLFSYNTCYVHAFN